MSRTLGFVVATLAVCLVPLPIHGQDPPKKPAWDLDEVLAQLGHYPKDVYLQYVAMMLGLREGRDREVAERLERLARPDQIEERGGRRDRADLFSTFTGALAIQEYLARVEWLGRRADPVAYARHLRRAPLPGIDPAHVLVEYALGDRVVPNPTTAALVRAGALGDRTVVVRTDRVVRASGAEWPDPHGFLLAVRAPGLVGRVAMLAQEQVARFLKDEGETVWVPESLSSAGPDSRFLSSDSNP